MTDTTKLINDGGPAYPGVAGESGFGHSTSITYPDGSVRSWIDHNQGVSMLDYFAAKAMQGLLAYPGDAASGSWHNNATPDAVADQAYKLADAMLAERNRKP